MLFIRDNMVLDERKNYLLEAIIKENIKTAKAIGSGFLAEKYGLDLSPATIRNEMNDLENGGYLTHTHTSAGRVPTEKGYRYYIENFLNKEKDATNQQKNSLKKASVGEEDDSEWLMKKLAKTLANLSQEAVFIGFEPHDVYYTGISNMFKQPEFSEMDLIQNMSAVVDQLDEAFDDIFENIHGAEIKILIGKENPFDRECGAILTKYRLSGDDEGLLGILGPMRMDYNANLALVKYVKELISNLE